MIQDYKKPEFLWCELPIKDNSFNDTRVWVYHTHTLSLIEIINLDEINEYKFTGVQQKFSYVNTDNLTENYIAVFTQNNCHVTDANETEVINKAIQFFKDYLLWEDKNINKLPHS